ncbi:MAG: heavy-metal-associated domain-containing protein [Nigerium sp.]|nr:heavy-metal-associated domain-containing protein [Nigerium sp.]
MVDLTIKDTKATGGGCGCGCGGHQDAAPAPQATSCDCGPDCACGCQEGKPCTCGASAQGTVASYTVSGMTCSHCVGAVTEEVSAIPGVTEVSVDLESGALKVTSEAPVDFDRIVEAVAEAGDYTVA